MNLKARNLHRDLGYFYVGLIISFAFSGILIWTKRSDNPYTKAGAAVRMAA